MLDLNNEPIEAEIMEIIDEIVDNSTFNKAQVIRWYKTLRNYECFRQEMAEACLGIIGFRRVSVNSDSPNALEEPVDVSVKHALCDAMRDEAFSDIDIDTWIKKQYGYNPDEYVSDYDNGDRDYMEILDEDDFNIRK